MAKIVQENINTLSSWQKFIQFFIRNPFAILASIIALLTWWQEKVTVEKHQARVAEASRLDNSTLVLSVHQRVLQIQASLTEMDRKSYGSDTVAYKINYFTNLINEWQVENQLIYVLGASVDIDGDSATQLYQDSRQKNIDGQAALNTNDYNIIKSYHVKHLAEFSAQASKYNLLKQPSINTLVERLSQQRNRYFLLYALAALLIFIDRVSKVQPKLKSYTIK